MEIIKRNKNGGYEGLDKIENPHLKNLFKAILEVDDSYYYCSAKHKGSSKEAQEQLERVFAYELYHQWSNLLKEYNEGKSKDDVRVINGEPGKKLDGFSVYPDMILHKGQDDWHHQEVAVEIKRKIALSEENLFSDLNKLSDMVKEGKLADNATPFEYGVFILTGGTENDLKRFLTKEDVKEISDKIICVFTSHKGELTYTKFETIKITLS